MRKDRYTYRKRELMSLYDEMAPIYNRRYKEIQSRKYENIGILSLGAGTTLDVGCGTGLLLHILRNRGDLLVGVDASTRMLRIASRDMRKRKVKGDLIQADSDSLPFRDNVFVKVMSVTVLQNICIPQRTIGEIARVMIVGGRMALTCLRKKHSTLDLKRMFSSAVPNLEITSEWDNNEEDVGINATKLT